MFRLVLLVASIISLINGGIAENEPQDLGNTLSVSDSLTQLRAEITDLRRTLNEEVHKLKKADEKLQENDLLDSVPLGTILPWVNKPFDGSPHQEDLPMGFALCDGSPITEGVWQGEPTPDLTTAGKFLRGGDFTQVLQMEEAMIQDHLHIDLGHTHNDAGHTHNDTGHTHPYEDKGRFTCDVCRGVYLKSVCMSG